MVKHIKNIEVNNKCYIELSANNYGIVVSGHDEDGAIHRSDLFSDGEIVMALNLLRYMRDEGMKSVYLFNPLRDMKNYQVPLLNGDIEEFQIFQ